MLIKDLPSNLQFALHEYFNGPYPGYVYVYNNVLVMKDLENHSFHELFNSRNTVDSQRSIALSIVSAMQGFLGTYEGKSVLDVGCRIGHFSILIAENGAQVTAVEVNEPLCQVARALTKLRELNVDIINNSIQDYFSNSTGGITPSSAKKKPRTDFDLVLMLNVFDHIIREGEEQAWNLLNTISETSPRLVLMMGPAGCVEKDEDIPLAVASHTRYKNYKALLRNSYAGRTVWGFTKT